MTLLDYTQCYTTPKARGSNPTRRRKNVIVIVRPYCSPDPNGPKYEQYCKQKLMLHKAFRHVEELQGEYNTYSAAYAIFLQSGNVPPSLEDDIHRLEQTQQPTNDDNTEVCTCILVYTCMYILYSFIYFQEEDEQQHQPPTRAVEEWMLICQRNAELRPNVNPQQEVDWTQAAGAYPNLEEMSSFIARQRESTAHLHHNC